MDRPVLRPIVGLSSGPKIHISAYMDRRKTQTGSLSREIKIKKGGTFWQLVELPNCPFPYPGLAQGGTRSKGP